MLEKASRNGDTLAAACPVCGATGVSLFLAHPMNSLHQIRAYTVIVIRMVCASAVIGLQVLMEIRGGAGLAHASGFYYP